MKHLLKLLCLMLILLPSGPATADSSPTVESAVVKMNGLTSDSGLEWLTPILSEKTRTVLNRWTTPEQVRFAALLLPSLQLREGEKWEAEQSSETELILTAGPRTLELFVENGRWVTDISQAVEELEPVIAAAVILEEFDQVALDADEPSALYPFLGKASVEALRADPDKSRSLLNQLKTVLPGLRELPLMDLSVEPGKRAALVFEDFEPSHDFIDLSMTRTAFFVWEDSQWKVDLTELLAESQ